MSELHRYAGYVVVGIFSIGWLFGLFLSISKRQAGDWFWRWLVAAQVLAIGQALIGIVLLLIGLRPSTWLHYVYGFGPILVLVLAHALAREGQRVRVGGEPVAPWIPFAGAAFICFGLALRALMTGLGIG